MGTAEALWEPDPPLRAQVCLLGKSRTYPPAEEASVDAQRTRYINSRRGQGPAPPPRGGAAGCTDQPSGHPGGGPDGQGPPDTGADGPWLSGFRPRERAERVRNCASLPREFVDAVVLQVAQLLLAGRRVNTGGARSGTGTVGPWSRGGTARTVPPGLAGPASASQPA